jgi:hypothetical protein
MNRASIAKKIYERLEHVFSKLFWYISYGIFLFGI